MADAPEVIRHDAPELDLRQASRSPPEVVSPPLQPDAVNHTWGPQGSGRYYTAGYIPEYSSSPSASKEAPIWRHDGRQGRRFCGLRKRWAIVLLVASILLVIIGVVLGVLYGVVVSKQSEPFLVQSRTGIAITKISDSNDAYAYFQNPDGHVFEVKREKDVWTRENDEGASIVTAAAAPRSPLAAVSYRYDGYVVRQLFFISPEGLVSTVNRTDSSQGWTSPIRLTDDVAAANSVALAACIVDSSSDEPSIRVYYGSKNFDHIRELDGPLNGASWSHQGWLVDSDPVSGVACSPHEGYRLSIYAREQNAGVVKQWSPLSEGAVRYLKGSASSPTGHAPAKGADISTCKVDEGTEYVFYHRGRGSFARAVITDDGEWRFETVPDTQDLATDSKSAALCNKQGAIILYQPDSSNTSVRAVKLSPDGELLNTEPVEG